MSLVEPVGGPAFRQASGEGRSALWAAGLLTLLFAVMPALPRITLFSSLDGYLAAHQSVETFATVVAALVFGVVWNAHKQARAGSMSLLAACLLGVALLNMGHTLSYTGMPAFITPSGPEKAIAFWLAQRILLVTCLLTVSLRPWRPFADPRSHGWVLGGILAWVALCFGMILFAPEMLPRTFIPGEGLTQFKVVLEITLNLLLLLTALLLWRVKNLRGRNWMSAAAWVLGLGGLYFAAYSNLFDIYNQLGHAYTVIAYALLYQGLFIGAVREPFEQIRETGQLLAQANEELHRTHDELEERVAARTRQLQEEVVERQYAEDSLRGALAALEQHQHELEEAKEEALRASRAKSDFLSSMSHELRTPLNAVLGFAQLLQTGRPGPINEKQASQLEHIIQGGNHLLQLIGEVLDLARIEAGNLALSIEKVEAAPLLEESLELARSYAQRNGVTVEDWQVERPVALWIDYTRFKQVLLNLMSNAVKYNRPNGRVGLSLDLVAEGWVRVSVSDTGPGIPAEKQSQLFEPFNRLGAEATEIEGTGVGLTITKRLVEAMHGRIGFHSEPGQGSTFWVEIPCTDAGNFVGARPQALPANLDLQGERKWRLLYVEDNPANIRLMAALTAEMPNLVLTTAEDARLGLELARRLNPDIIVLDINMPGINGFEAVHRLKSMPETQSIPVIALTANVSQSAVRRGLQAGFARYLTKPLDIPQFLETLDALLPSGIEPVREPQMAETE